MYVKIMKSLFSLKITTKIFLITILCFFPMTSCSSGGSGLKTEDIDAHQPAVHSHRVTYSGETLALISKWYTGSIRNWVKIFKSKPGA